MTRSKMRKTSPASVHPYAAVRAGWGAPSSSAAPVNSRVDATI